MILDDAIKHAEEVAEDHTKYNRYGGFESCDECAEEHRQLAKQLKELKQLKEQTRWIPCSERLPEDYQRVLVTIVNYNGDKVVRVAEYSRRTFKIKENYEHWQVGEKGLLAWQPLPKPYKVEKESE